MGTEFSPALERESDVGVRGLRPAVLGNEKLLSAAARREILGYVGAKPVRFSRALIVTWLSIAAAIALATHFQHLLITILAVIFIGTRQSVLALLLHEQVHRLGLRSKYSDWIINVLAVYPLLVTTVEDYAKVHLLHHKYFFTDQDPDFVRKSGEEWTFPKSLGAILKIVARDVTAMNLSRLIRGKSAPRTDEFTRRNPSPLWLRVGFFAGLATALTLVGGWTLFVLYWVLPLITVAQLMIRWIAVAEHEYNIEHGSVLETTPIIILTWWQKLLFPDLNFGYHVYHHLHPGVSFSYLPLIHQVYLREGMVDEGAIFKGQGSYLRQLVCPGPR